MAMVALVFAIGSVTLMSFKTGLKSSTNQTFGMQIENPGQPNESRTWVPLDGLTEGLDYKCEESSDVCKGEFGAHQIDPSTNLPYENETPESTSEGDFELIP
jgi:hypothetical protein